MRALFKDKINGRDEIVIRQWVDKNKALNSIEVPVKTFAALFPIEIKDDDNKLGYKKVIADWKAEKLI